MKTIKIAVAVLLSTALLPLTPSVASDLAVNRQTVETSANPWMAFNQLSKQDQLELIDHYKANGYPAVFDITLPIIGLAPPRHSRSYPSLDSLLSQTPEFLSCIALTNLTMCLTAKDDASTAEPSAQARFPSTTVHYGKGDAYRHCYWSGLMTRHIGSANALAIAENHETHAPSPALEYQMDTYNNTKGRIAGLNVSTDADVRYTCYAWANNGTLITLL